MAAIKPNSLHARPADPAHDMATMGIIGRNAFSYSSRLMFPIPNDSSSSSNPDPDDLVLRKLEDDEDRWRTARMAQRWKDGCPAFVAVDTVLEEEEDDDSGEKQVVEKERIVGISQWKPPKGSEERWKRDGAGQEVEMPATMDVEMYQRVMGGVEVNEKRVLEQEGLGEEDIWYLMTLATVPDQKRRGIGKMLLQWGLDQAKADRKHVFLTATDEGRFLYEKVGFKVLGDFKAAGKTHYAMLLYFGDNGTGSQVAQKVNGD